jgi:hypothetical protein
MLNAGGKDIDKIAGVFRTSGNKKMENGRIKPNVLVALGFEPRVDGLFGRRSPNWATRAAIKTQGEIVSQPQHRQTRISVSNFQKTKNVSGIFLVDIESKIGPLSTLCIQNTLFKIHSWFFGISVVDFTFSWPTLFLVSRIFHPEPEWKTCYFIVRGQAKARQIDEKNRAVNQFRAFFLEDGTHYYSRPHFEAKIQAWDFDGTAFSKTLLDFVEELDSTEEVCSCCMRSSN